MNRRRARKPGWMCSKVLIAGVTFFTMQGRSLAVEAPPSEFRTVLMPLPASVTPAPGTLPLAGSWTVKAGPVQSARLQRAVDRTLDQLSEKTGVRSGPPAPAGTGPQLTLEVQGEGEPVQGLDEDESYSLKVDASGVRVTAKTVAGAMHGLQTMLQLVQPGEKEYELPFVTIEDAPRFRWRGLMIDCGRHFEPMAVLKRTLDGMAAV